MIFLLIVGLRDFFGGFGTARFLEETLRTACGAFWGCFTGGFSLFEFKSGLLQDFRV